MVLCNENLNLSFFVSDRFFLNIGLVNLAKLNQNEDGTNVDEAII